MNRVVLNRLIALGGELLTENDYAVLIDMVSRLEAGEMPSIQEVAEQNYMSPSSVTRLCKKFGFGFREMRQFILDELRGFGQPVNCKDGDGLRLEELKRLLFESVDQTVSDLDPIIGEAVRKIARAEDIAILGTGTSQIIGDYLSQRLQIIGKRADAVRSDLPAGVFVNAVNRADLVVMISRSGESRQILAKAEIVKRLNKDVVVLGCSRESTLGSIGNPCLSIYGSKRPLEVSKSVTAYNVVAFFVIDGIVDCLSCGGRMHVKGRESN